MKISLDELMQKLGVGYTLGPYGNAPWDLYDGNSGKTCSAEVRMNESGNEVEAELQFIHDTPPANGNMIEQILYMKCKPNSQTQWTTTDLWIRRENWQGKVYNWEEKSCNFFRACVAEIARGVMPDIEMLLERELSDKERFGGSRGGSGGKSPKIRPEQIMKMKGQGF